MTAFLLKVRAAKLTTGLTDIGTRYPDTVSQAWEPSIQGGNHAANR